MLCYINVILNSIRNDYESNMFSNKHVLFRRVWFRGFDLQACEIIKYYNGMRYEDICFCTNSIGVTMVKSRVLTDCIGLANCCTDIGVSDHVHLSVCWMHVEVIVFPVRCLAVAVLEVLVSHVGAVSVRKSSRCRSTCNINKVSNRRCSLVKILVDFIPLIPTVAMRRVTILENIWVRKVYQNTTNKLHPNIL